MSGMKPTSVSGAGAPRDAYRSVTLEKAEEMTVLPMLGMAFMTCRETTKVTAADSRGPQPAVYQMIVAQSSQFNLQTDHLIAGLDQTGEPTTVITHPGSLLWWDQLGHGAVGSGVI